MRIQKAYLFATSLLCLPPVPAAPAQCVADWCTVGDLPTGPLAYVYTMAVFDAGQGPRLFLGGFLEQIADQPAENLAVWDGRVLTPILPGANGLIRVLKVLDDGSGPALYAGGAFTSIGGAAATYVARFDGSVWHALATDLRSDPNFSAFTSIHAIEMFDDGAGAGRELYIGGFFSTGAGGQVRAIAKRTPSGFVALGSGLASSNPTRPLGVGALHVFDDGSGPALYAGGSFDSAGARPARNVASWNGQTWTGNDNGLPEATGGRGWFVPTVTDFAPDISSAEPRLLACGDFILAGRRGLAQWDGVAWTSFGGDFSMDGVRTIKNLDLGSGPQLYVSGTFASIDGINASLLARRLGSTQFWEPLGLYHSPFVDQSRLTALATFDDGDGIGLFAGGRAFAHAVGSSDFVPLARYGTFAGDLDCDRTVGLSDLAILLSALGTSDAGDLNGDGETTMQDLSLLLARFGEACS